MAERPELPTTTWPNERYPQPAEWVAWYETANDEQRLEIARRFIAWHQEANRCFNHDHMGQIADLEGRLDRAGFVIRDLKFGPPTPRPEPQPEPMPSEQEDK